MNIKGINTHGVSNIYKSNRAQETKKVDKIEKKDSIEISSLGKSLTNYSNDIKTDNSKRVEEIKKQLANGTYSVDGKLTADKMLEHMKGKRV